MNRKIHLLGELSKFGETWEMEAKSIGDAVKLIDCQKDGFRKFLIEAAEAGLDLAIVGKDFLVSEPEELVFNNLGSEELYFSLVPTGSKKGWGRILLAAVLIVVSFFFPVLAGGAQAGWTAAAQAGMTGGQIFAQQALFMVGMSIGMMGITQLLAKTPDADDEKAKAGLFDGPISTLKQGQPVPVLYGKLLIGGTPIHVDLTSPLSNSRKGAFSLQSLLAWYDEENGEFNLEATGMTETEFTTYLAQALSQQALGRII